MDPEEQINYVPFPPPPADRFGVSDLQRALVANRQNRILENMARFVNEPTVTYTTTFSNAAPTSAEIAQAASTEPEYPNFKSGMKKVLDKIKGE